MDRKRWLITDHEYPSCLVHENLSSTLSADVLLVIGGILGYWAQQALSLTTCLNAAI